jgi:hypothetical protein
VAHDRISSLRPLQERFYSVAQASEAREVRTRECVLLDNVQACHVVAEVFASGSGARPVPDVRRSVFVAHRENVLFSEVLHSVAKLQGGTQKGAVGVNVAGGDP